MDRRRLEKSSGKAAAPRMDGCHGASVQAVPSGWRGRVTLESSLQVMASPLPRDPRLWWASAGLSPQLGAAPGAPEPGRWGAVPPPAVRLRRLRRRCPPRRALGLRLQRSKCLPGASRQGGAGAASRCAAALGTQGQGLGSEGRSAGGRSAGEGTGQGAPAAWGAGSCPLSPGARLARHGGRHSGALPRQAAREAAGLSATAFRTPGKPPPAPPSPPPPPHRRRGVGK